MTIRRIKVENIQGAANLHKHLHTEKDRAFDIYLSYPYGEYVVVPSHFTLKGMTFDNEAAYVNPTYCSPKLLEKID